MIRHSLILLLFIPVSALSADLINIDLSDWDLVTELGVGYKVSGSDVMLDECNRVVDYPLQVSPNTYNLDYSRHDPAPFDIHKCGGGRYAFVGWPLALEKSLGEDVAKVRWGWFHYSNWFVDTDEETHMDAISVSLTVNWSKMFQTIRLKRAIKKAKENTAEAGDWDNRIKLPN